MKNILRLSITLATLAVALPSLRAEGTATPDASVPTTPQPSITISLPNNLKAEDVANAVTKAFTSLEWTDSANNNGTVTASLDRHGIKVKATAVCSASEIKITTEVQPGSSKAEKANATVQRWLRNLEKNTKEELGILPKPVKKEKKETTE